MHDHGTGVGALKGRDVSSVVEEADFAWTSGV